jgi:S-adenosylmethionine decarboxylase
MDVGTEWLIDAFDCRRDRLADVDFLHGVCDEIIAALDLHVVGQAQWRQFPPPGGVTALCLLTESHLSLHTYPEKGVATLNLYCCRARPAWDWEGRLRELLGARQVSVRMAVRGSMEIAAGQSLPSPGSIADGRGSRAESEVSREAGP